MKIKNKIKKRIRGANNKDKGVQITNLGQKPSLLKKIESPPKMDSVWRR
jgi:hypothetical protein